MDKRYQVFVSSTYIDLIEERSEVMQALLELDCMPAGMELFPAANDTQWNWIKRVIDESDYYIVIVGGRYGSISKSTGLSFTEMEYRYAVERGKPVIGFLHHKPSLLPNGKCEQSPKLVKKLEDFRDFAKTRLCKFWENPSDLGAKVSRSITQLIKQHPAIGWAKADLVPSKSSAEEILKLKRKIEALEAALETARTEKPAGTDWLSSGKDSHQIEIRFKRKAKTGQGTNSWRIIAEGTTKLEVNWDKIFSSLSPSMIRGINEWYLRRELDDLVTDWSSTDLTKQFPGERFESIHVSDECFRTILIQLRALKLITPSEKGGNDWSLTPYGDNYMTKLLAVQKPRVSSIT